MTIYIGADHRGYDLKQKLIPWLQSLGYIVVDCGNDHLEPLDDFVDFTKNVATNVVQQSDQTTRSETQNSAQNIATDMTMFHNGIQGAEMTGYENSPAQQENPSTPSETSKKGIVICGSGVGASITANRYKGIRCALAFNKAQVAHACENDHINIISLASEHFSFEEIQGMVTTFLTTQPLMKDKYLRRKEKLDQLGS